MLLRKVYKSKNILKQKCTEFLSEKNLDVRYGLVEYKDIYDDGQMKYCVQDKDFLFKDKLFTIMTGSEYKAKEKTIKIPFYGDYTYITSDNVSEYFKLATSSGAWIRYFSTTIKQMVLGKWSKDSNAIGVIGETGVVFTGLDIAQDVRDLAHDVTHFEASWSWVGETALDGVSLIPVIGVLSKVDEASFFIKHSDDLMEVRTVAKLNGTVFDAAKRVTSRIDNLTLTAKVAIENLENLLMLHIYLRVLTH